MGGGQRGVIPGGFLDAFRAISVVGVFARRAASGNTFSVEFLYAFSNGTISKRKKSRMRFTYACTRMCSAYLSIGTFLIRVGVPLAQYNFVKAGLFTKSHIGESCLLHLRE